jgi:hypothetical protein
MKKRLVPNHVLAFVILVGGIFCATGSALGEERDSITMRAELNVITEALARCGFGLSSEFTQGLQAWKSKLNEEEGKRYEEIVEKHRKYVFDTFEVKPGSKNCSEMADRHYLMLAVEDALPRWADREVTAEALSKCGFRVSGSFTKNLADWKSKLDDEENKRYLGLIDEYRDWTFGTFDFKPGSKDCEETAQESPNIIE